METAALTLYGTGLLAAFGWRTVWQWRRTGRSGWVGLPRDAGVAARLGVALFGAALLAGLAGVLAPVLGAVPVAWVPPVVVGAGLLVAVAGLVVVLASQAQMGRSWRIGVDPGERTDLMTGGVFGWVRNPVFSGMVAFQAGLAVMVPSWWSVVAVLLLVVAVQLQVRVVEEPYLRRVHGRAYRGYSARVGRFVPGVGKG
jgi:protein-S-isoprenylcysteine O-methyltransferase Ste14